MLAITDTHYVKVDLKSNEVGICGGSPFQKVDTFKNPSIFSVNSELENTELTSFPFNKVITILLNLERGCCSK